VAAVVSLSLGLPNFGRWYGDDPRALVDLARAADDAGVDRLVVTDHVVMGGDLSAYVWGRFPTPPDGPWLEPLTVLTAIAGVTARVRLATGILIAPLRPATVLAKTVATLDALSGGRVDLGVGVGWQEAEYAAAGLDFTARGAMLDDTIGACRELWSRLPASYSSPTVTFDGVYCVPQPVQRRLPVWFSGTLTARTVRRIEELGDGWIPIMGASLDDIREGAARLRSSVQRPLEVQASVRVRRRGDGGCDLAATMAEVPGLVAAGVTNVYLNAASFAASPGEAAEVLPAVVREFAAVAQ
jgi:probable F420-dependent oxidoreductase